MSYLTYSEYCSFNTGTTIEEGEFDTLSFYADTAISAYIGEDVKADDTIKRAAALQIAQSKANVGISYYTELSANKSVASESLGDYSYSLKTSDSAEQAEYGLFPIVASLLRKYVRAVEGVNVIL